MRAAALYCAGHGVPHALGTALRILLVTVASSLLGLRVPNPRWGMDACLL